MRTRSGLSRLIEIILLGELLQDSYLPKMQKISSEYV